MRIIPRSFPPRVRWTVLILALGWGVGQAVVTSAAGSPGLTPATNAVTAPRAVFSTNLANGKDPFFPTTARFTPKQPSATKTTRKAANVMDQLVLKGIAINPQRRLALINNLTLAQGETAPIRFENQTNLIQCVEVRERSALVAVIETKEVRELYLRD
jgi:hypothetical protein